MTDTAPFHSFISNTQKTILFDGMILFARIDQDETSDSPLAVGYKGRIYSYNQRHNNFNYLKANEALKSNPDAVALSFYEHGLVLWGTQEFMSRRAGVEFEFDGTKLAGVWVPSDNHLEYCDTNNLTGDARRTYMLEQANATCAEYTKWCNGEVYMYRIELYSAKFIDGILIDDKKYYQEDPIISDENYELLGFDVAEQSINESIQEIMTKYSHV